MDERRLILFHRVNRLVQIGGEQIGWMRERRLVLFHLVENWLYLPRVGGWLRRLDGWERIGSVSPRRSRSPRWSSCLQTAVRAAGQHKKQVVARVKRWHAGRADSECIISLVALISMSGRWRWRHSKRWHVAQGGHGLHHLFGAATGTQSGSLAPRGQTGRYLATRETEV